MNFDIFRVLLFHIPKQLVSLFKVVLNPVQNKCSVELLVSYRTNLLASLIQIFDLLALWHLALTIQNCNRAQQ